jgi:hypothetical protein
MLKKSGEGEGRGVHILHQLGHRRINQKGQRAVSLG